MKPMEEARRKYEEIPIPKELELRVSRQIAASSRLVRRRLPASVSMGFVQHGLVAAAAAAVIFTAALNTSTVFAETMGRLPVIGPVARVLTFRSWEQETEDMKISVQIPSIQTISDDFHGLADSVNQEIYDLCQQYADEAMERAREYRTAFLETGGTEAEWAAHQIEIRVWYEVKSQNDRYLSLAVMGEESWSTAYSETRYYNFDLQDGRQITLSDLLGDDYAAIAKQEILRQMETRQEQENADFWPDAEEMTIDETTDFYINEAGNPVVVFDRYEVAPGAAGRPEFEIGKAAAAETAYKDNFEVPAEAAADFARQIKAAVAERDLEKLADLTAFPVYVKSVGDAVETRDAFLALEPDQVFTEALAASVEAADETALSPSMAGFSLADGSGAANIIFGVRDGKLAISGINP